MAVPGQNTRLTNLSDETKSTDFFEVMNKAGVDLKDQDSIESYMRGRGYTGGSIRAVKRGARQLVKNLKGRSFHLSPTSGFRIYDDEGNEVTREGRGSGNRKGFTMGDLVGLGDNVSKLASLVRTTYQGQQPEDTKDGTSQPGDMKTQITEEAESNYQGSLDAMRKPAPGPLEARINRTRPGSSNLEENVDNVPFTGTRNFRGQINAFNETTGSKRGLNFRGQQPKSETTSFDPYDMSDLRTVAPEGTDFYNDSELAGMAQEGERAAIEETEQNIPNNVMPFGSLRAGAETVSSYLDWREKQAAQSVIDRQKFMEQLKNIKIRGGSFRRPGLNRD